MQFSKSVGNERLCDRFLGLSLQNFFFFFFATRSGNLKKHTVYVNIYCYHLLITFNDRDICCQLCGICNKIPGRFFFFTHVTAGEYWCWMKMDPKTPKTETKSAISPWRGQNGALLRFLDASGRHTLCPNALRTTFSIIWQHLKMLDPGRPN